MAKLYCMFIQFILYCIKGSLSCSHCNKCTILSYPLWIYVYQLFYKIITIKENLLLSIGRVEKKLELISCWIHVSINFKTWLLLHAIWAFFKASYDCEKQLIPFTHKYFMYANKVKCALLTHNSCFSLILLVLTSLTCAMRLNLFNFQP